MSVRAEPGRQGGTFLEHLVRALRAADEGVDASTPDFELLGPLVLHPGERPAGAADPEVFWRIEAFFRAVGAGIEERTGVECLPLLRMRREGFGLVVLLAGRLVAVSRWFQDASAFHFDSLEALAASGARLVHEGVEMVERHPEVARAPRDRAPRT
jgi:probable nitrogen fixation protein